MRALSIQQPYASAIIFGPKRIENRTWRGDIPDGGEWIAVHASAKWYRHTDWATLRRLWPQEADQDPWQLGAIIGVMRVERVVEVSEINDPWAFGPWCWVISKVVALNEPLHCSGWMRLWLVGDDEKAHIERVLEGL